MYKSHGSKTKCQTQGTNVRPCLLTSRIWPEQPRITTKSPWMLLDQKYPKSLCINLLKKWHVQKHHKQKRLHVHKRVPLRTVQKSSNLINIGSRQNPQLNDRIDSKAHTKKTVEIPWRFTKFITESKIIISAFSDYRETHSAV